MNTKTRQTFVAILPLFIGLLLFSGCDKNTSIKIKTSPVHITYSQFREAQLGILGMIDITKLYSQADFDKLAIRKATWDHGDIKADIVIIDKNRNGKFNDSGTDLIGLGHYFVQDFDDLNLVDFADTNVFKIGNQQYLLNVDNEDKSILLKPLHNNAQKYHTFPYLLPHLKAKVLNGSTLNTTDLLNKKLIYMEFWGTWCKPCIQSVPDIRALSKRYGDKVEIISVDFDDKDLGRVKQVVSILKMNWVQVVADQHFIHEFGDVHAVPCGMLFYPDGRLLHFGIGPKEVARLLEKHH